MPSSATTSTASTRRAPLRREAYPARWRKAIDRHRAIPTIHRTARGRRSTSGPRWLGRRAAARDHGRADDVRDPTPAGAVPPDRRRSSPLRARIFASSPRSRPVPRHSWPRAADQKGRAAVSTRKMRAWRTSVRVDGDSGPEGSLFAHSWSLTTARTATKGRVLGALPQGVSRLVTAGSSPRPKKTVSMAGANSQPRPAAVRMGRNGVRCT